MNRRNFLKGTAIALVGTCIVPSIVFAETRDPWTIFTPSEIKRHWKYVGTPVFSEVKNFVSKPYAIKAWKLKLASMGIPTQGNLELYQKKAKEEIDRLRLTHVYSVSFISVPIYYSDNQPRYCTFVRGARVI